MHCGTIVAVSGYHLPTPRVSLSIPSKLFKFRSFSSTANPSSLQFNPHTSLVWQKQLKFLLPQIRLKNLLPKFNRFGQLQDVDLQSIEPSIIAETDNNLRDNVPQTFEHRDAMTGAIPSYEEPYIKVPRVLSMD